MNLLNSKYLDSRYPILKYLILAACAAFVFILLQPRYADAAVIFRSNSLGLSQGLVGYWSFDGNHINGTRAYDASGNNNQGTLTNGPKRTTGKLGQALEFDGVDDYVSVADLDSIEGRSALTVSVWAKSNVFDVSVVPDWIITKCGSGGQANKNFELYQDSDEIFKFHVLNASTEATAVGNAALNDMQIHHLVGVWDGSNVSLYIDTAKQTSNPALTGTLNTNTTDVEIAKNTGCSIDASWPGQIDEVRVYNRALTAQEVKRLYNQGASKINKTPVDSLKQGLVGYWTFDATDMSSPNKTNQFAIDRSGNNNTGTLASGPKRVAGKLGQALEFDGSGSFVNVGNPSSLGLTGSMTQSAWVQSAIVNDDVIVSKQGGLTDRGIEFVYDGSADRFEINISDDSNNVITRRNNTAIIAYKWYHVVGVYNADVQTLDIYINGSLDNGTLTGTVPTSQRNSTQDINIGKRPSGGDVMDGLIDDVRIYNRALTAQEVKRLYNQGASKFNKTPVDSLKQGLVGYWTFDATDMSSPNKTNQFAIDRSGNNNSGTLTSGPKRTIGKLGQALDFDGVDDCVSAGTPSSLNNLTTISVSAWIKPDTFGKIGGGSFNDIGRIMSKGGTGGWIFGLNNLDVAGSIEFYYYYGITSLYAYSTANSIALNQWQHVAATWTGGTTQTGIIFYVNGINVGRASGQDGSGGAHNDSGNEMFVGLEGSSSCSSPAYLFDGLIDEVRVYNRALSAEEVRRLYNMGR